LPVGLRFIEDDFGLVRVEFAIEHVGHVHVVHAHRAGRVTGHAAECQGIPIVLGDTHVLVLLRDLADRLDQRVVLLLLRRALPRPRLRDAAISSSQTRRPTAWAAIVSLMSMARPRSRMRVYNASRSVSSRTVGDSAISTACCSSWPMSAIIAIVGAAFTTWI